VIALARPVRDLDPLSATSRSDELVARQIYEPLIENLTGPYGDVRKVPGLALSAHPSEDQTVWSLKLRQGVRFQDGALFNAGAVLANAKRWTSSPLGRGLLPSMLAVDAPRPDLVRFILDQPDPDFPDRLDSPRLGIVSPRALKGTKLTRETNAGTGPFEVRERSGLGILLASTGSWWGTRAQLGPALDQVEFRSVPSASERLAMLRQGTVQIAEELPSAALAEARRDPLLTTLPGHSSAGEAFERSVRGVHSATEIPFLAGAWLTRIGAG